MGDQPKTFVKDTLEAGIEQITAPKKKPQSANGQQVQQKKSTAGVSDQVSPGKVFADALKQTLGFGHNKPVPTQEEIDKMNEEDQKKAYKLMEEEREKAGIETVKTQQPKANLEVVNPQKQKPYEEPAYIRGKPGYDPQQVEGKEKEKKKLPELPMPKGKPPRGSLLSALERKKHGSEIKGGRE